MDLGTNTKRQNVDNKCAQRGSNKPYGTAAQVGNLSFAQMCVCVYLFLQSVEQLKCKQLNCQSNSSLANKQTGALAHTQFLFTNHLVGLNHPFFFFCGWIIVLGNAAVAHKMCDNEDNVFKKESVLFSTLIPFFVVLVVCV